MADDHDDGEFEGNFDDNNPSEGTPDKPVDYEIGYGKPPTGKRFQPGQSGNPDGRPKGTLNLKSDLEAELGHRVATTINGKRVTVSRQRLILRLLVRKAAEGDLRAAEKLLNMVIQGFGFEDNRKTGQVLSPGEQAMVDALAARLADDDANDNPEPDEPAPASPPEPDPDQNLGGAAAAVAEERTA